MSTTNKNLFEEAIADAKAVKTMAIANAKAALEETFTPHLQKIFTNKVQEIENNENKEVVAEIEETNELEEVTNEEVDLDELLAELEGSEEVAGNVNLEEVETEEAEEVETEETEDEFNFETATEADLENFVKDVIEDMIAAGEIEANHEEGEEEIETGEEEVETNDDEEVNLDEVLNELGLNTTEKSIDEAKKKAVKKVEKKDDKKDKELKEALDTIKALQSDMNDVNLLNAKLLYTNKVFKAKNLNESEKIKVLNAFDKAKTVSESKLVYETILESLKDKKVNKSITESMGSASKATTPTTVNKPILENSIFTRMQVLAGLGVKK